MDYSLACVFVFLFSIALQCVGIFRGFIDESLPGLTSGFLLSEAGFFGCVFCV